MTTEQFRTGQKTVTLRLGWVNLKPGDVLMGVEKCQGLRKGERHRGQQGDHGAIVRGARPTPRV
jgi:hypothetical protein